MIVGKLVHWRTLKETERFGSALAFLERASKEDLPDGKYEIDGALIYAGISSYTTRPPEECKFEAHRRFVDIQCMLRGTEQIRVTDTSGLSISESYSSEKDVCFYKASTTAHSLEMAPGDFAVFFPDDGHMPGIARGAPQDVRKIVVKIDLSTL